MRSETSINLEFTPLSRNGSPNNRGSNQDRLVGLLLVLLALLAGLHVGIEPWSLIRLVLECLRF